MGLRQKKLADILSIAARVPRIPSLPAFALVSPQALENKIDVASVWAIYKCVSKLLLHVSAASGGKRA